MCFFFIFILFSMFFFFFFFNDTATTEIYTLSLHDALPISSRAACRRARPLRCARAAGSPRRRSPRPRGTRSEEHTSELQSRLHLVCRLLLEKKKKKKTEPSTSGQAVKKKRKKRTPVIAGVT